jgi:hypothetical protein
MKASSKMFLEEVSKHCSTQITHYTFNQNSLKVSDKYKEGRLSALNYVGELTFYFFQEEKQIKERFQKEIKTQMKKNSCLMESDYKKGLYDALNDVLSEVDRI